MIKERLENNAGCGSIYGLGFIGSLVYFMSNIDGFGDLILGILKSLVWPAVLVYEVMEFLAV